MNAREIGTGQAYPAGFGDGTGVPGRTIRQAYKIAAINAILLPSGDGSQYGPSAEDCKKAADWAANVADAMLQEDSEHLGRQG